MQNRLALFLNRLLCAFALASVSASPLLSQSAPPAAVEMPSKQFTETLKSLFSNGPFRIKFPSESRWLNGGDRYTILEPSPLNPEASELVAYDTATGKRTVLIAASKLVPPGAQKPLSIDDYTWSADKQSILIFSNAQKVWRQRTRGDYWLLHIADGKLTRIGVSGPKEATADASMMFAKLSPDGKAVAWVSHNNLYVEDLATEAVRQLTSDGSADIINGTTDWVTEEELSLRDAFRWSPDSQSIAYWQFDQSGVGEYTLINDTRAPYPETTRYKYPHPGGINSSVRVGVLPAAGGATRWINLPGDPRNHYIPRMDWAPEPDGSTKSSTLILEYLNRKQNDNQVYLANATTGDAKMLFEDTDAAWVDIVEKFEWLTPKAGKTAATQSQQLVWLSEKDGWRHAYLVSRSTGEMKLITKFPGDVVDEVALDEAGGYFYFIASPSNPIQRFLYRSRLDGSGAPERVTPKDLGGMHNYDISPNGKWAIHSWSSATRPPSDELVELPTHKVARPMIDNNQLVATLDAIDPVPVEFTETKVSGDVTLSTFIVKPPNFDPQKKYPMIVYVYSEPAGATVNDSWAYTMDKIMAREGYVVVSFDNQGTPEPKGRDWRKCIYGDIGVRSSKQQDEAITEFTKEHTWIDPARIAMWGHSGGGSATLNQMFRYPGHVAAGVAIAPMADQLLYDTVYQERYMGLPADNAKGYHDGSPISYASGLTGHLLIIHGSGDDNVHFQGTEMLVDKLVAAGKPFEFMDYPNRTHALSEGQGTLLHRFTLQMRFFEEHVPPGPR